MTPEERVYVGGRVTIGSCGDYESYPEELDGESLCLIR